MYTRIVWRYDMTFEVNGKTGPYDKLNGDESIKYGLNAASNHKTLAISPVLNDNTTGAPILDFAPGKDADETNKKLIDKFIKDNDAYLESLPPLQYEYRYMPNVTKGTINKKALFGAAIEEMGQPEMSVNEFEDKYILDKNTMTANPIDINKDGKIDIPEYSTTILATDMLSKDSENPDSIDGTINSKGMNALLAYSKKSNAEAAAKLYSSLYNHFELNKIDG